MKINRHTFFPVIATSVVLLWASAVQSADNFNQSHQRSQPQYTDIRLPDRGLSSHRGENFTHPENTLVAFREAIRLGAHQIELDIYLTDFGDLVVIHDRTVDRTTDGSGDIRRMTLEEIKSLDAGSWKDPRFAGERIPTLDEVLEIMPINVWLNLHLKGGYELGAAVAQKVLEHNRAHQAFLAADHSAAAGARAVYADIMICGMGRERRRDGVEVYINTAIQNGDAFIQLLRRDLPTPEQMQRLKAAGIRVNLYGTNDPNELERFFKMGIDFPLVDDLKPMMERTKQLGIDPWKPIF